MTTREKGTDWGKQESEEEEKRVTGQWGRNERRKNERRRGGEKRYETKRKRKRNKKKVEEQSWKMGWVGVHN